MCLPRRSAPSGASRSQWRLPVVAALHDVQRLAVEVDARAAGHGGRLQPPGK